jgi:hypothetical protein
MRSSAFAAERGGCWPRGGVNHAARREGRALARQGFESAEDARRAARTAYDALRAWLARERRTASVPGPARPLWAERDGRRTRLTLGGVPIGRLVGPTDVSSGRQGYGFELMLPPCLTASSRTSAARVIDDALARRAALYAAMPGAQAGEHTAHATTDHG